VKADRRIPSPREAVKILQESGCSPNVIRHCKAVARLATKIALKCKDEKINVDVRMVHIGALLHDIGRSKTHSVHHVAIGAEIARSLNLHPSIISIIERHVGGGITADEAEKMGLPNRSYVPETLEEKIVAYADKLVEGSRRVPVERTLEKLKEELGADHPSIRRVRDLYNEISTLIGEEEMEDSSQIRDDIASTNLNKR